MSEKESKKEIAVKCRNIKKTFGTGDTKVEALRGVDLTIYKGELRMLMGPSGSGKTTLISIIAGILSEDAGECLLDHTDLNKLSDREKTQWRGKNVGFVFQAFNLVPMLTVEENVAIPLLLNGVERYEALQRARKLLDEIGIGEKNTSSPTDLSGGQQQRVAIARALIHAPKLIVCDEPTSSLDHETGHKIMMLLREMIETKGTTLIVVTHDVRITSFADKIDYLEDGMIVKHHET